MADARDQRTVAVSREQRHGRVALVAVGRGDPDLDQLVVVERAARLRHDPYADAGVADAYDGVELMRETLQMPALLLGEFHGADCSVASAWY